MTQPTEIVCELQHGVQLVVKKQSESDRFSVRNVADFLSQAMQHFKCHRDTLKTGLYTEGPFSSTIEKDGQTLGTVQLSTPPSLTLTASQWVEAVIDAYTKANSIEQMLRNLPAWKAAAQREGSELRDIVGMLDEPDGDLTAMAAMLRRGR